MSSPSSGSRSYPSPAPIAVAVEPAGGSEISKAHMIPSASAYLGRHGLASCGFPVDQLRMMPTLDWATLDPAQRCEHCAAETAS